MSIIRIGDINTQFTILNRCEGLSDAFRDLFSGDYRTVEAASDNSLDINAAEMVGYMDPNGAGKSTTIKMMTGILKATSGVIQVNGQVPYNNRIDLFIGFVAFYRSQLFPRPQDLSPLICFALIVGLCPFTLTYWIWMKGVNSYTGTGA